MAQDKTPLAEAIDAGNAERVEQLIAADPRVLAEYLPYHYAPAVYCPLARALRQDNLRVLEAVLKGLTDPATAEQIKHAIGRPARERKDGGLLNDNLLYPLCLTGESEHWLPHFYARNSEQLHLLAKAGYDLSLRMPRKDGLPHILLSRLKEAIEYGTELQATNLLFMFGHLRFRGIALNRERGQFDTLPETLARYYSLILPGRGTSRKAKLHHSAYEYFASLGVDLRPVLASHQYYGGGDADITDIQWDLGIEQAHKEQAELRAYGRRQAELLASSPPSVVGDITHERALFAVCATGELPRLLHRIAMSGEAAKLDAVTASLDEYWREEYRHSLHAAEAALARRAPVEQSALAAHTGRAG